MDPFWIIVSIGAVGTALSVIVRRPPRSADARAAAAFNSWLASCRARGLNADEKALEMTVRLYLARLTRMTNARTLKEPGRAHDIMLEIIKSEAKALGMNNRPAAKLYLDIALTLTLADVLYDDAMEAVTKRAERRASKAVKGAKAWTRDSVEDFITAFSERR